MSRRSRHLAHRLPLVITATLAVAALAACSANPNEGSGSPTTSTNASVASGPLKSAVFVNPLPQYPAWRTIGDCIASEAKARGIDFTETGPTGGTLDATKMIQQIQQATANKKGAIITFPASDAFTPVLQQAQKAGIVTGTLYGDGGDVVVGPNYTELGKMFVDAIAKRPGQQNLGLLAQSDTGQAKQWADGVMTAAKATSNVKVVGTVYTNDDAAKALDQANALLTAHPEINVMASHMGSVTPGVVAAIKARKLVGKVVFVASGADNGGKEAVADGIAYGAWLQGLCDEGKTILNAVADKAEGKTVASHIDAKETIGTKDDLTTLLGQGWG
ncbi:ABC-type sugar transport system substrate-binding protein [Hamadaea flava]|uniref:Sugar ABC transporter substrate-binding protein n=1 Tax=Hamadaea flava TaxID=1742688 RepID=A0ABV8LN81_9ACTN|nr:sugar ABC transporter substrate-binding protein [Hamadaea flava]MCP2329659.1 ABC-type sugar transport system substrate-binding protein [Hamadaea flava]